ncbi:unnamed protein product [Polarella glacialis]|uniref:Uncharacterized protein n=1 Tax=Polarella glacialis TaxID=89957 RepID=A0A813KJZ4_POLGL|nr:unnamed protein product [Polarella glacialis]
MTISALRLTQLLRRDRLNLEVGQAADTKVGKAPAAAEDGGSIAEDAERQQQHRKQQLAKDLCLCTADTAESQQQQAATAESRSAEDLSTSGAAEESRNNSNHNNNDNNNAPVAEIHTSVPEEAKSTESATITRNNQHQHHQQQQQPAPETDLASEPPAVEREDPAAEQRQQQAAERDANRPPETLGELDEENQIEAADMVIHHLEHLGDPRYEYEPDIILRRGKAWDLSALVADRVSSFTTRVRSTVVDRLLRSDTVLLDKVGLDPFETLVICRAVYVRNPQMQFLTLNGNRDIGPDGARHVAKLLSEPGQQLLSLLMADCSLKDEGIRALAEALRENKKLQILDLRQNQATDRAAEYLSQAVSQNCSLESLYLNNDTWTSEERGNCIGDIGAWLLAMAVADRSKVLRLSLQGNLVSESARDKIKGILGRCIRF